MSDPGARRRLGRYELIAEVASGGMGIVCLARSVGAGGFRRLFAIKVMHPHLVRDQQFVGMLLDEAQLAARIHHPNVVATVDICTVDDCYFVVMDYIDGFQLLQVLEHPNLDQAERIRVLNRVLLDAMAGLEAAHTLTGDDDAPLGLVHRDVSPQNILIGLDGIGRLTDFGIALAASRISSSRPGTIKGKPAYMAPEQARARSVDRRADIWALGVILWESLTGQRLFVADTEAATVLKVIDSPIEPPRARAPGVSEALESVCLRALERDPARRYDSARQMAAELERAAISSGQLADSHEVADTLKKLFGSELERRRVAIRTHAAAIGPSALPMHPHDIYELPLLGDELPPGVVPLVSPLPRTPEPNPPATTHPPRRPPMAPTAVAATMPATPAPSARTTIGAIPEMPRRATRSRAPFLLIAVVLGAAVLGFWFVSRKPVEANLEPPVTANAVVPPPPSVAEEALPALSADVAVTPAPSALAAESESALAAPAPIKRSSRPRTRPPSNSPAGEKPAAGAPTSKGPVVEENPYGLR